MVLAKKDHRYYHLYYYNKAGEKTERNAYFELPPGMEDEPVRCTVNGMQENPGGSPLYIGGVIGKTTKELKVIGKTTKELKTLIGTALPKDYAEYLRRAFGNNDDLCRLTATATTCVKKAGKAAHSKAVPIMTDPFNAPTTIDEARAVVAEQRNASLNAAFDAAAFDAATFDVATTGVATPRTDWSTDRLVE